MQIDEVVTEILEEGAIANSQTVLEESISLPTTSDKFVKHYKEKLSQYEIDELTKKYDTVYFAGLCIERTDDEIAWIKDIGDK